MYGEGNCFPLAMFPSILTIRSTAAGAYRSWLQWSRVNLLLEPSPLECQGAIGTILSAKHVTCEICGKNAMIQFTEGLLRPDLKKRVVKVIRLIDCPTCGCRSQTATLTFT